MGATPKRNRLTSSRAQSGKRTADDRAANPAVEVFARRIQNLAYEVAHNAPVEDVIEAAAATSNARLLSAFAALVLQETQADTALTLTLLEGQLALARAVEEAGGLWSADEAVQHCQVTRSTLQNWRDQGKVLAIQRADGAYAYPIAQFVPPSTDLGAPRPHPAIAAVIAAARDMSREELVGLLITPQESLAAAPSARRDVAREKAPPTPRTGFEAIRDGNAEAVLAMLADLARPVDDGAPPIETSAAYNS